MPTTSRSSRAAAASDKPNDGSDFLKLISVDFSSLETRFDEIFARIEAVELRLDRSVDSAIGGASLLANDSVHKRGGGRRLQFEDPAILEPPTSETTAPIADEVILDEELKTERPDAYKIARDPAALAEEIEALRAAQLRLKIDHELTLAA